jgi:hypothetical protein
MTKNILAAIFILTLCASCGKEEAGTPPESEDLVADTGGKSDTGYFSTLAEELEGEFTGEMRLDVSDNTPEERTALVAQYQGNGSDVKSLAMDQVKFGKNKINAEQLHMNLYSDVVETDAVELVDETVIRIAYRVKLESIVSTEELEKAGKSLASILAAPPTTVKLPADPRNLFTRIADRCAEGFDAGSLADYNYFYYFNPDKAGCDVPLTQGTFKVTSQAPPTTTYPEYDRLKADNKVAVMVIFGAAEHEETVSSNDWGVWEWNDFKRDLQQRDFTKDSDLQPGERFRRVRAGIEETIDILSPYDIYNNPESDNIFKRGITEHEIILYNGHSFYGSLNVLRDCAVYPAGAYQIFYMGSCWSYEYYTRQIFECKKSGSDPYGWDLADVVNDTESGWFHNNAEFSRILLTNLFAGAETGGKDGSKYYTWLNIITAMNKQAIDAWHSRGTETHEILGVSGVKNNKYDPEAASPSSQGKRYESTARYDIPDNAIAGVDSEIVVTGSIIPRRITVAVDITHPYIGDLRVVLKRGSVEVVLKDRDVGTWEDDIVKEYDASDIRFVGQDGEGSWILHVDDGSAQDTGSLNSWSNTLDP